MAINIAIVCYSQGMSPRCRDGGNDASDIWGCRGEEQPAGIACGGEPHWRRVPDGLTIDEALGDERMP